jgi:hypothetical protein
MNIFFLKVKIIHHIFMVSSCFGSRAREQFVPLWDGKKPQKYSPCGRVGGFQMRRYQGLAVPTYGGALECLAYESRQHVKYPD